MDKLNNIQTPDLPKVDFGSISDRLQSAINKAMEGRQGITGVAQEAVSGNINDLQAMVTTRLQAMAEEYQEKTSWLQNKYEKHQKELEIIQEEIVSFIEGHPNNTTKYVNEKMAQLNKLVEDKIQKVAVDIAEATESIKSWFDEQKKIIEDRLKDMIQRIIKAQTL